jgi:transposase
VQPFVGVYPTIRGEEVDPERQIFRLSTSFQPAAEAPMKIRTAAAPAKPRTVLILAADVSKETLHLFSRFEAGGREVTVEDVVPNRTQPVEGALAEVGALAEEHELSGVRVICESSGGFERLFLRVAQRLGFETALVSPEQAKSFTKLETLDTAKTDKKDARVIHWAGRMEKTQRHRDLPEPYVLLRRLTAFHDDEIRTTSAIRTRLQATLCELFPDYGRPLAFTFSKTGRVLLREGLLCPYRLVCLGQARLLTMLRRRIPGVKAVTAERLVSAAEASVRSAPPVPVAAVLSDRLSVLMAELEMHEAEAERLKEQIEIIGARLKAEEALPPIDEAVSGITLFNLARLVGQTGPLSDFASKRQLLRYAGMNLRERESGTYKGQTRLSKKGRPLLRKVLGQAVFPVLRGDRLLGERYAERRKRMPEQKARVAAMRKLLVMLWGAHRSAAAGVAFDPARVHVCQSEYALAA